jgi:7-carboxy-7-deazaguanine synthase
MFGKNKITGRKYFKHYENHVLKVRSIFYTIQGEGPLMGKPAVFVRLSHCNLTCSFCDAFFEQGVDMTFAEIYDEIRRELPEHVETSNIVITGGEPMLQTNIVPFIDYMRSTEMPILDFQIESNGMLWVEGLEDRAVVVISPKCNEDKDGNPTTYKHIHPDAYKHADALKFLVDAYHNVADWVKAEDAHRVYISPINKYHTVPDNKIEGELSGDDVKDGELVPDEVASFWEGGLFDMEANRINHEYAGNYALKFGYRINLQMHNYLALA